MTIDSPETSGADSRRSRRISVFIGILAVMLAICSLGGGNATKEATLKNIEVTNTWAFFQARNIRRTAVTLAADDLDLLVETSPALAPALREKIAGMAKKHRDQAQVWTTGREGLDDLYKRGKELEAERDLALRRDPYFDYGGALLQIAIVLASVAIIAASDMLLWVSAGLAVLGGLATFNGFFLLAKVPFIG